MRIAVIVALIWGMAGAIWWASIFFLGRFDHADPLSAHGHVANAQAKNIATVTGTPSPAKSVRDTARKKLLEKVATIMRGKKG